MMLISLKKYCDANGLPFERVKRLARAGKITGAAKTLDRWGIDSNTPIPVLPESKRTGRTDGRFVYRIWATPTESEQLAADGYSLKRANPTKPKSTMTDDEIVAAVDNAE